MCEHSILGLALAWAALTDLAWAALTEGGLPGCPIIMPTTISRPIASPKE